MAAQAYDAWRTEYEAGSSLRQIAAKHGTTFETIRKHLHRSGTQMRPKSCGAYKMRIPAPPGLAERFHTPTTVLALAVHYGVSWQTVHRWVYEAGLTHTREERAALDRYSHPALDRPCGLEDRIARIEAEIEADLARAAAD